MSVKDRDSDRHMKSLLAKPTQSLRKLKNLQAQSLVQLHTEGFRNPISSCYRQEQNCRCQWQARRKQPLHEEHDQTEVSSTSQLTNSKHIHDLLKYSAADQLTPELFNEMKAEIGLLTGLLDKKVRTIEQLKNKLDEKNSKIKLLEREIEILRQSNEKLLSLSIQAINENKQKNKESETVRFNLIEKLQGLSQENEHLAKALRDQNHQDGRLLYSDRSSLFKEELEAIQKRAYFSQEGLTLLKDEVQGSDSNRIFKNEGLSRKDIVKKKPSA